MYHMEEFTREYVDMWKRWSDFEGRSNVREFWMPVLVNILVGFVFSILANLIGGTGFVEGIYGLLIIVPFLALFVRRMHDIGKSGWNILWIFVLVIGWVYLIYLLIQPSK